MTSQYAGKLRDAAFGKQFVGLTLKDFEQYDVATGKVSGKVNAIKNPAPEAEAISGPRSGLRRKTSSSWMNLFLRHSKNDHEISGGVQESIAEEGPEPPDPGRHRLSSWVLVSLLGFNQGYEASLNKDIDNMGFQIMIMAKGCPYEAATLMLQGGSGLRYMKESIMAKIEKEPEWRRSPRS